MTHFSFKILKKDKETKARAGIIHTRHGNIETPYLIPVATRGEIIGLNSNDISMLGIQCLMANTYHLHLKPGESLIEKKGGLNSYMDFGNPIMTDSAGFQAFSLGLGKEHGVRKFGFFPDEQNKKQNIDSSDKTNQTRITEEGIEFTYNNKTIKIGPKESMQIQSSLGSDIIMALDECTSPFSDYNYTKKAMERTHFWALQSLEYHNSQQALYGIIQGGYFKDLREISTRFISSQDFDGIAIGGSLGKSKHDMLEILSWITPHLENDTRPRHMLGIGYIYDIFKCVECGIDTFDCVAPQREARHGTLYISPQKGTLKNKFRLEIKRSRYKGDKSPIDKTCNCITCKKYTRHDLHIMYKNRNCEDYDNYNYIRLATLHNLHFMLSLMKEIRESIKNNSFTKLREYWLGPNS